MSPLISTLILEGQCDVVRKSFTPAPNFAALTDNKDLMECRVIRPQKIEIRNVDVPILRILFMDVTAYRKLTQWHHTTSLSIMLVIFCHIVVSFMTFLSFNVTKGVG